MQNLSEASKYIIEAYLITFILLTILIVVYSVGYQKSKKKFQSLLNEPANK